MRVFVHHALKRAQPDLRIIDAEQEISGLRMIKTPQDIAALQAAIDISERALARTLESVRLGQTENRDRTGADPGAFRRRRRGPGLCPHRRGGRQLGPPPCPCAGRLRGQGRAMRCCWISARASTGLPPTSPAPSFWTTSATRAPRSMTPCCAPICKGLEVTRAGVTAHEIDDAVTGVLEASPFADRIRTKTGHGLGRDVHEAPYIMRGNHMVLPAGTVYTNEPGLYQIGNFGVRIEDDVLITEDGCRSLTAFPEGADGAAMLNYCPRRLLTFIPTFIGVTLISFGFIRVLPGDPIIVMAGERGLTEERYAELVTAVRLRPPGLRAVLGVSDRRAAGRSGQFLRHQETGLGRVLRAVPGDAGAVDLRDDLRGGAGPARWRDRRRQPRQVLRPGADVHRAGRLFDADLLVGAAADHRVLGQPAAGRRSRGGST